MYMLTLESMCLVLVQDCGKHMMYHNVFLANSETSIFMWSLPFVQLTNVMNILTLYYDLFYEMNVLLLISRSV